MMGDPDGTCTRNPQLQMLMPFPLGPIRGRVSLFIEHAIARNAVQTIATCLSSRV